jgi:hypothetical protein
MAVFSRRNKIFTFVFVFTEAILVILDITFSVSEHILKPISISVALLYVAALFLPGRKR